VVITEVMADPRDAGDATGEWFELLVKAQVDLNGVVLSRTNGSTTVSSSRCVSPDAGSSVIFARSADPALNGGLPPVLGTFTFDFVNTGGALSVLGADGGLLDTMTAPAAIAATSYQLDVNKSDHLLNDVAANWCNSDGGQTWTIPDGGPGEKGTPGRANVACQ
jgi:hypothetical protein